MSSLSILVFAALLCFTRAKSIQEQNPVLSSEAPFEDDKQLSYEHQVEVMVQEMAECMDRKLAPFFEQLSDADEAKLRGIGINNLFTFIDEVYAVLNDSDWDEDDSSDEDNFSNDEDSSPRLACEGPEAPKYM